MILVAVAGFGLIVLALAAGSITLLTALLLTAWLPAAALPAALAAMLTGALAALLTGALAASLTAALAALLTGALAASLTALVLAALGVALRLVAVFRITLRSVAIRHVHASCIQLLGKDSPGPDTHYDPAARGLIGCREFPR